MKNQNDSNDILNRYKEELLEIIYKNLPGCRVYLFGSRATGTNSSGSDVDIALDYGKKIEFKVLLTIKDEIEDTTLPFMVDVVDFNSASEKFKKGISKEWIEWKS